jgi:hypothetical protein
MNPSDKETSELITQLLKENGPAADALARVFAAEKALIERPDLVELENARRALKIALIERAKGTSMTDEARTVGGSAPHAERVAAAHEEVLKEHAETFAKLAKEPAPALASRDSGLALVVVAHGRGSAICWDAHFRIKEFVSDGWGGGETFNLDAVDHEPVEDGVFIAEMVLVDDGPGDYPGTRETALQLRNFRRVSEAEWGAFLAGDWPWKPFEKRLRCRGCGAYADEPRPDRCEVHGDAGHGDIEVDERGMSIPDEALDEIDAVLRGDL